MPRLPAVIRTVLSAIVTMVTVSFSSWLIVSAGHDGVAWPGQVPRTGAVPTGADEQAAGTAFRGRGSARGGYEPVPLRASAEGVPTGWNLRSRRCGTGGPTGSALGDQAQLPGPGDGLGGIGRAQLGQNVADVLLDGEQGDEQLLGDGLVRGARGQLRQHLSFPAGQRVDDAGHSGPGSRPEAWRAGAAVERPQNPGQVPHRDAPGRGPSGPVRR